LVTGTLSQPFAEGFLSTVVETQCIASLRKIATTAIFYLPNPVDLVQTFVRRVKTRRYFGIAPLGQF
jgi:hypothetical protein